jgi:nucleotide-binding universal stress UspA family protein
MLSSSGRHHIRCEEGATMNATDALLKPILVPLDGSTLAEEALPIAGAIAHRVGADIHLVAVQLAPVPPAAEFGLGFGAERPDAGTQNDAEAYLTIEQARLSRVHGVHACTTVILGAPAEALADYVRTHRIGLVVMTTHGRGGFSRFWLGSVADQLLRRVDAPVLLLRHGAHPREAAFQQIAVALDGSSIAERTLEPAIALALAANARIVLVRVVQPPLPPVVTPVGIYPPDAGFGAFEEASAAAAAYLDQWAQAIRTRGISVDTRVLIGSVAEQIVGFAEQSRTELIAIGTRSAKGMDRLMLGGVADKVVRAASQPVLVVPAERPHRAGQADGTTQVTTASLVT